MPKKPARNAFWFFMADWKTEQESKGRSFPNGFRDVQADPGCSDAWRALSPAQKAPYAAKAKNSKGRVETDKKTSIGESIDSVAMDEQRKIEAKLNMDAHIRHTVDKAKQMNALPGLNFVFIHMNWYYMREPNVGPVDFCPAEFAIAEFSLEQGVSRYYHEIIKTDIELGYQREALETSERTHKLHPDAEFAEGDWAIMYHQFKIFIEPLIVNGKMPPLYTAEKYAHILPSLLRRLTRAVGREPEEFSIYTIESLFAHMVRAVTDYENSNTLNIVAERQLSKELFAYTPNIECNYHKMHEGTSQYCSLSVVRQWAFEFCDQCCRKLRIDMVPGIHFPEINEMVGGEFDKDFVSTGRHRPMTVLSATGVSERHRIMVSERTRDEEVRRRMKAGPVDFIDHSLLNKKESERPVAVEEKIKAHVPDFSAAVQGGPMTSSQAAMGRGYAAPIFDNANFPAIGRGTRSEKKTEPPRMVGAAWTRRNRKEANYYSDSDSE